MSWRRSWALVRHESRILRRDPLPFVLSVTLPLFMMWFLRPAMAAIFSATDGPQDGAAQAVPGMAVLYAMFLVANVAFGFLRELDWRTWSRLRSTDASTAELIVGKLVPGFVVVTGLLFLLVGAGVHLFSLDVEGSWWAVVALLALFGAWLTACGAVIAAICRTAPQATAIANLLTLVLSGIGGALFPAETLPSWVRVVDPLAPTTHVMDGLRNTIEGGDLASVASDLGVLTLWCAATAALGLWAVGRRLTAEAVL
jgi:ABC-2 type transport system permease protein